MLLPAGLWAHFGLTPEEGQQIRNRGGYSPVLNGVAVGFSASAQCLAAVSAQQSRSDPWEGRETAWLTLLQSCPGHCKNKQGSAVEQKHCSGCPGRRQHSTSTAFMAGQGERTHLPAAHLCCQQMLLVQLMGEADLSIPTLTLEDNAV